MAYAEAVIQKGYVRGLCAHIPCSLNKKHAAHMDMGGMDDMDLGGEDEEGKEESGAPVPRTKIYFQSRDSLHCETI